MYYLFTQISGMGMTLFFVLSGFVIHYNYSTAIREMPTRGTFNFLIARFARLYPLYILMVLVDLLYGITKGHFQHAAPPTIPMRDVIAHALPWYVLMMQTWVYRIIGSNSLVYQFGVVPQIAWSISTEWFFYLAYPVICLIVARLATLRAILGAMLVVSVVALGLLTFTFAHYTDINTYAVAVYGRTAEVGTHWQDSYFRWLIYFSPYSRIAEFLLGCLIAVAYMHSRAMPVSRGEERLGMAGLCAAIVGLLMLNYVMFAPPQHLTWYHMSYGFAPLVAVVIFCCARYDNRIVAALSRPYVVAAGEASYSIYLLHMLVISAFATQVAPVSSRLTGAYALLWLALAFISCVGISLVTYRLYEAPARRLLRAWLTIRPTGSKGSRWRMPPGPRPSQEPPSGR